MHPRSDLPCATEVASTVQPSALASKARAVGEILLNNDSHCYEHGENTSFHLIVSDFFLAQSKINRKDESWIMNILHKGTQADKRAALQLRVQVNTIITAPCSFLDIIRNHLCIVCLILSACSRT